MPKKLQAPIHDRGDHWLVTYLENRYFNNDMIEFIKKIVGTKNEREIKRLRPLVVKINDLEADYQKLSDAELRAQTEQFKQRIRAAADPLRAALESHQAELSTAEIELREELKSRIEEADKALREEENRVLQELLPEAFAAVREASRRAIGLRH